MDAVVREQLSLIGSMAYVRQLVVAATAYFAAAQLALSAGISPSHAGAVWPASGIALACVLLFGYRVWPGVWLGAALSQAMLESSPTVSVLIGAGSALEALAAAALVHRCIGLPGTFKRGEDAVEFVAIAGLGALIAAAAAAAAGWAQSLAPQALASVAWTRWQADAMGMIVAAPVVLGWSARPGASWSRRKMLEFSCLALPMLAVTYAVFGNTLPSTLPSLPLTFVILPFVIWAALRFEQREVATLNAMVCALAVWHTLAGRGPFAAMPPQTSTLLLLAFTSSVVITGLVLNAVVGERGRAIETLAKALKSLKEDAIRDPLTGLYNRRFLQDYLPRELLRAAREGFRVAVIMLDLDHFKRVNDTKGHGVGDFVLIEIASLLKRHIRGSDIACRYGGEEFTLVLPNATAQSARNRAEEICAAVRKESDRLIGVTASLGVAIFPTHAEEPESLLRAADRALYEAKGRGRDQVRVFSRGPAVVTPLRPKAQKRAQG